MMKYSRLLKATSLTTFVSAAAAGLTLVVFEIAWPLWDDPHGAIIVNWVFLAMVLGWVLGMIGCQQVLGIGFATGASRKTMILTQWTHGIVVAVSFSVLALLIQRVLEISGVKLASRVSSFPHFMAAGGMINSLIYLTLLSLVAVAIGSLAGVGFIYLPSKVVVPALFIFMIMVVPLIMVIGMVGAFGVQQLWPGILTHAWVQLVGFAGLTAVLGLIDYLVYQHLDAPQNIRRR